MDMSTSMTAWLYVAVALAWLPILLLIPTILLAPNFIKTRTKALIQPLLMEAADHTAMLKTERARAAGTLGTVARKMNALNGGPPADDEEEADDRIPPFIRSIAEGAGIDINKAMAGDPEHVARAQELLKRVQQEAGNMPAASPGGQQAQQPSIEWM